jgi:hypothetical protein
LAAGGALLVVALGYVWGDYGLRSFLPELVAGFAATLAGVILALDFERRRDAAQAAENVERLIEDRRTEIRRRFGSIVRELEINQVSLRDIKSELWAAMIAAVSFSRCSRRAASRV